MGGIRCGRQWGEGGLAGCISFEDVPYDISVIDRGVGVAPDVLGRVVSGGGLGFRGCSEGLQYRGNTVVNYVYGCGGGVCMSERGRAYTVATRSGVGSKAKWHVMAVGGGAACARGPALDESSAQSVSQEELQRVVYTRPFCQRCLSRLVKVGVVEGPRFNREG